MPWASLNLIKVQPFQFIVQLSSILLTLLDFENFQNSVDFHEKKAFAGPAKLNVT